MTEFGWLSKLTQSLFMIAMPVSVLVTILYWLLLAGDDEDYWTIMEHVAPVFVTGVDFFFNRITFEYRHSIWLLIFMSFYGFGILYPETITNGAVYGFIDFASVGNWMMVVGFLAGSIIL